MTSKPDRIAIISAIQDASSRELKALAEIKNAIASTSSAKENINTSQGRVSRRLSRTHRKTPLATTSNEQGENPYVEKTRRSGKNNTRISTQEERSIHRHQPVVTDAEGSNTISKNTSITNDEINIPEQATPVKNSGSLVDPSMGADKQTGNTPAPRNTGQKNNRDSKGRFTSKNKSDELARRKERQEDARTNAKLQSGFLRKLGSLMGLDGKNVNSDSDNPLTDAAGVGAGGPLWMAAKGALDIAKETTGKVVSLKEWVSDKQEKTGATSKAKGESRKNLSYPAVEAKTITPPEMGKSRSSQVFASSKEAKAEKAVQEQTKTLATNDERIVNAVEDVADEVIKLRKSMKGSSGFSLGDLFRKRLPSFGRGGTKRSRNRRTPSGSSRETHSRSKDKKKTGKTEKSSKPQNFPSDDIPGGMQGKTGKPKKTSKGKAGKLGKLFGGLGAKVGAGVAATVGAVKGVSIFKGKTAGAATEALEDVTANAGKMTGREAAKVSKTAQASSEAAEKATSKTITKAETKATESLAQKNAAKAAETTVEKVTANTAEKTTANVADKVATGAAEKTTAGAAEQATVAVAEKATAGVAEKAAGKATGEIAGKAVLKAGGALAVRGAARAIPVIGTLGMAALDAAEGYNDEDGQRAAFGVAEDNKVNSQQKASYAAANMLDMGGIVSGSANLLGKGLSAIGMSSAGDSLQNFDTGTIARGVNSATDGVKSLVGSAVSVAGAMSEKVKSAFSSSEDSTKQVKTAVEEGTKKTVQAIDSLKGQLQGGTDGQDGVGVYGYSSPKEFSAPANNTITSDLNVGGANAKSRNYRNNNLGNLVFANQEGASLELANAKGERRFAKFNTPEEGVRALANQVSSYYNGTSKAAGNEKLQTVSSIIAKWAPPNENNTNQYIKNVSEYLGVSPNEKIDVSNPEVMTALVRAIATKEGGNPAVNDGFIKNALGSYNLGAARWEGQFSDESLSKINEARTAKGDTPIAKNSQYSAGNKVTLANGAAPAKPVKNTFTIKVLEKGEDVVQHAQSAKKKQVAPAVTQPAAQKGEEVKEPKAATAAGSADEPSGSSMAGVVTDTFTTSLGLGKDMITAGSPGALAAVAEKARGMDQAMTAKIEALTGTSIGFKKAAPLAEIDQAITQKKDTAGQNNEYADQKTADTALVTVDLLNKKNKADEPEKAGSGPSVKTNERGMTVFDNGYKIIEEDKPANASEGEDKGVLGSLLDSSISGLKRVGAAVLPAAGDQLSRLIGGMDGGGIVNDLVSRATGGNIDIARAISPATQKVSDWLNGGVQQTAGGVKDMAGNLNNKIFGQQPTAQEPFLAMPPQLPTVTDLARSGIRQPLTSDTANHDPAMLKALDGMYSVLKDILNVNKTDAKGDPDKVSKSAQPQPRQRASTTINDPSLDALLED